MSSTLHHKEIHKPSVTDDQKSLAMLYDEHAAAVLGLLEKLVNDKGKAEELLRAVFLALPSRLHEFDAEKGRFRLWLLKFARTIAGQGEKNAEIKTKGSNAATNAPIHKETTNVNSSSTNSSRPLTTGTETPVVELLYVKGYTFAQAAAELGVDERSVRIMVRTELKKYRR